MADMAKGPTVSVVAPLLLLLLLFGVLVGVQSITFLGPSKALQEINGALFSYYNLAAQCSAADINVPQTYHVYDDSNTTVIANMTLTCRAVTITYDKTLAGYVPKTGTLESIEVCKARDNTLYQTGFGYNYSLAELQQLNSLTGSSPPGGFPQHWRVPDWMKRMRMYSTNETDPVYQYGKHGPPAEHLLDRDRHQHEIFTLPQIKRIRSSQMKDMIEWPMDNQVQHFRPRWVSRFSRAGFAGPVAGAAAGLAATLVGGPAAGIVASGLVSGLVGGLFGGGGSSFDLASDPAFRQLNGTVTGLSQAIVDYYKQFNDWAAGQQLVNDQTGRSLDSLRALSLQQMGTSMVQQQEFAVLNSSVNQMANWVQNNFNLVASNFSIQQQEINSVVNSVNNVQFSVDASVRQAFYALSNLSNSTNATIASLAAQVQVEINSLYNLVRQLQRVDKKLLGILQSMNLNEAVKVQLTLGALKAIANATAQGNLVPFLLDYGGAPTLTPDAYAEFLMGAYRMFYLGNNGGPVLIQQDLSIYCDTQFMATQPNGWFTIQDFYDMLGPSGCLAQPSQPCLCYIAVTKWQCPYNTTGNFSKVQTTQDITNSSTAFPQICTSAATLVSSSSIDDLTTFQVFLQQRCAEQTVSTSAYIVNKLGWYGVLANYSNNSPSCGNIQLNQVMELAYTPKGVEWALFQMISLAFGTNRQVIVDANTALNGAMPQGLTFKWTPFVRRNGQDLDCTTGYFMLFSQELVPIYTLTNPRQRVTFDIQINGVTTTQTDVLLGQTAGYSLEPRYWILGEPDSTTTLYDAPPWDLSLSPAATSRIGPTYTLFPNASCSTNKCWQATNGIPYDHLQGMATASLYARQYDPSTRTCLGQEKAFTGSWCTTLKDYFSSCPTNDTCILTARNPTYLLSDIRIPGPVVAAIVFSDCPSVSTTAFPTGVQATLTNLLTVPVTVKLQVTGPCPEVRNNIVIPASGTTTQIFQTCDNVPTTRPLPSSYWSNLTVFKLDGIGFPVCNNSININVTGDRLGVQATTGMVDLGLVQTTSVTIVDPVTIQLASIAGLLLNQIQETNARVGLVLNYIGLTYVPTYNSTTDAVQQQANALLNSTAAAIALLSQNIQNQTLLQSLAPFNQRLNELAGNFTQAMDATNQAYQNALAQLAAQANFTQRQANLTANLILASDKLVPAFQAFLTNVYDVFQSIAKGFDVISSGNSFWDFLGVIGGGIVDIINAGAGIAGDAYGGIKKLASGLGDLILAGIGLFTNLFTTLSNILPWAIFTLGILFVLVKLWKLNQQQSTTTAHGLGRGSDGKLYDMSEVAFKHNQVIEAVIAMSQALSSAQSIADVQNIAQGMLATNIKEMKVAPVPEPPPPAGVAKFLAGNIGNPPPIRHRKRKKFDPRPLGQRQQPTIAATAPKVQAPAATQSAPAPVSAPATAATAPTAHRHANFHVVHIDPDDQDLEEDEEEDDEEEEGSSSDSGSISSDARLL